MKGVLEGASGENASQVPLKYYYSQVVPETVFRLLDWVFLDILSGEWLFRAVWGCFDVLYGFYGLITRKSPWLVIPWGRLYHISPRKEDLRESLFFLFRTFYSLFFPVSNSVLFDWFVVYF